MDDIFFENGKKKSVQTKTDTCGRGLNFGRGSQGMNRPKIIQFAYSCLCRNSSGKSLSRQVATLISCALSSGKLFT